jgi:hypothetical protein
MTQAQHISIGHARPCGCCANFSAGSASHRFATPRTVSHRRLRPAPRRTATQRIAGIATPRIAAHRAATQRTAGTAPQAPHRGVFIKTQEEISAWTTLTASLAAIDKKEAA